MTWELTLTGLLIGTLVGLTGMGGGSLLTPILVILFGYSPTVAIGSDIAHGAIFKTVSAIQHRRLGNVRARLAGWMFLGSAPMSLVGVWLADELDSRYGDSAQSVMAQILGGALLFGCVGLLAKTVIQARAVGDVRWSLSTRDRVAAVLIGLFGGFVVGLTSVGSGVFFGLTLLVLFPLRAHKVVGTDIFHAAALLYVAGLGHFLAGNVSLSVVGWLLLGSIPGALLGGHLAVSVPERPLRIVLALVLGLAGLKLVKPRGGDAGWLSVKERALPIPRPALFLGQAWK
ncbi:MAG: sulfite exporter TauE/SafE family protein [Thermoleophilia bacterium]